MKIFDIKRPDFTSDPASKIHFLHVDDNNTLLVTSLIKVEAPSDGIGINDEILGYKTVESLLRGKYTFDPAYKPNVNTSLTVIIPDLLGEGNYYKVDRISYLNKAYLGSGELGAHNLYGFKMIDGPYYNARDWITVLEAENIYSNSYNTKKHPRDIKSIRPQIFVGFPYPTSDFNSEETIIVTATNNHTKIVSNIPNVEIIAKSCEDFYNVYMKEDFITCKIEEISVNEDGSRDLKVSTLTSGKPVPNIPVYITTTAGYINKNRFVTNSDGIGQFKFLPLGLDTNDHVKISAGFRLFTGVSDYEFDL